MEEIIITHGYRIVGMIIIHDKEIYKKLKQCDLDICQGYLVKASHTEEVNGEKKMFIDKAELKHYEVVDKVTKYI